jgi:DNA-binding IclR family transcriptional regulator
MNSMSDTNQSGDGRSTAAKRMRLYRQRRRQGVRCVSIPLHVTEVHDLVGLGILKAEQRDDPEAVGAAVVRLIRQALDDMRW